LEDLSGERPNLEWMWKKMEPVKQRLHEYAYLA